jgi:hypothetical protein
VVPMQACQLLLGRPWLYDRDVQICGRTNKVVLMYKGERITLLPFSPEEILKDDLKRKQRKSENHLRVSHIHSEGVIPQPNKTPHLQRTEPQGKEGLVMMSRKGYLKELSEPNAMFFVLLCKDNFLSTNDLPSTLPSVVFMCYRNMTMCFRRKYHQGCYPREGLNIKSTLFLVLLAQTVHHTVPTRRKPKKFSAKYKSSSTKGMFRDGSGSGFDPKPAGFGPDGGGVGCRFGPAGSRVRGPETGRVGCGFQLSPTGTRWGPEYVCAK